MRPIEAPDVVMQITGTSSGADLRLATTRLSATWARGLGREHFREVLAVTAPDACPAALSTTRHIVTRYLAAGVVEDATALAWRRQAACRTSPSGCFFPTGSPATVQGATELAKAVCGGCEVRVACLDYAVTSGQQFGIWGGMAAEERSGLAGLHRRALPGEGSSDLTPRSLPLP